MCGAGMLALVVLGGILGTRHERARQDALELQKQHTSTIAVVNMDDGVNVGNERVNYANQLMSFPNDHFTVTGLTDAKTGIENGSYAAYVVIPGTFSESVTSIESNPRKVTLVCQYNQNLSEEAKMQAINDLNAFTALLNSNVAYVYLDAIMAEFHRVQDSSSTILANDDKELELLEGVDAAKLITAVKPVEEAPARSEVRPVELTAYTERNRALLAALFSGYSEAARKGKEEYAAIQEEKAGVGMAVDQFLLSCDAVVQDTAAQHARLLQEGQKELAGAVSLCCRSDEEQEAALRDVVADILRIQLEADRSAAESQLQDIVDDVMDDVGNRDEETLENIRQQWETAYLDLQQKVREDLDRKSQACGDDWVKMVEDVYADAYKTAYVRGYQRALEDLGGQVDSLGGDADSGGIAVSALQTAIGSLSSSVSPETGTYAGNHEAVIRERLSSIAVDWTQVNVDFPAVPQSTPGRQVKGDGGSSEGTAGAEGAGPSARTGKKYEISLNVVQDGEAVEGTIRDVLKAFEMKSESEQINEVIQTYFVDALSEESERQMSSLSGARTQLSQSMESFEDRLSHYDFLQYVEGARLDQYLNEIEANAGAMLEAVRQNNSDYVSYAAETYAQTTERILQARSSLEKANAQTAENVTDCVNALILSREALNGQNRSLLKDFTGLLGYTRVESQGNARVYDHVVNPVVARVDGQPVGNLPDPGGKKGYSVRNWLLVVFGIGILLCLAEIIFDFRRQGKGRTEEGEDVF